MENQGVNQHFEETVVEFLCEHFCGERGLRWVFRAEPPVGLASPEDFFSPEGFLPVIVQMAKAAAGEQVGFDCTGLQLEPDNDAIFGVKASITTKPNDSIFRLLVDAVVRLCGPEVSGRVINHHTLYQWCLACQNTEPQPILLPLGEREVDIAQSYKLFSESHPWSEPYKIAPSSRHLALAMEMLDGISDILGRDIDKIKFLRIVTIKGELKAYLSLQRDWWAWGLNSPDGGICSALRDFLHEIESRSTVDTTDDFFCRAGGLVCKTLRDALLREEKGKDSPVSMTDFTEQLPEVKEDEKLVEIIPESSIQAWRLIVTNSDNETANYIKGLLSRVEGEHLTHKKMAMVPDFQSLETIAARFPNFTELFDYLQTQFALAKVGNGAFRLPPILLLGEPGIGKTEILLHLTEVIKTDFMLQNMAAAQNGSFLAGSDIYWRNSKPGSLFNLLVFGCFANPVVLLDEIDKVARSEHAQAGSLYSLLERRSAAKFVDLSLPQVSIDASHVVWFAAGNDDRTIDPAILSRFKVFRIPTPTKDQMPVIIQSIYSDLLAKESWGKAFAPTLAGDLLSNAFNGIAPRDARQIIETACARAVVAGRRQITLADISSDIRSVDRKYKRIGFSNEAG